MPDPQLLVNARKETWIIDIFCAFNNNTAIPLLTTKLSNAIRQIFRYIEPTHFEGKLIVYIMTDGSTILDPRDAEIIYDKNILISMTTETIVINIGSNETLLMWEGCDTTSLFDNKNAIFYEYSNEQECFYANTVEISLPNLYNSPSIFCVWYSDLYESLRRFEIEKVLESSCELFKGCWFDGKRIFLANKPENTMQLSLKEFLSSSLRGVEVTRERNVGASKPVDVFVYWKDANRSALIEIKWLGKSKKTNGELATSYANSRARDGLLQVKEYVDLGLQDSPTCISKGYLVVIDARRRSLNQETAKVTSADGLYYQNKKLTMKESDKHYHTIKNIEKPLRMFAKPICN